MQEIDKNIKFEKLLEEFEKIKDLPEKYYVVGQLSMLLLLTSKKAKPYIDQPT